jgi:hypothetical protein
VYLQGSYKNDTNTRADSDVDLVVQLNSTFHSNLSEAAKQAYGFQPVSYQWTHFRADVLNTMNGYYGAPRVHSGGRSIKVETPHLPVDVVVCAQYREYPTYPLSADHYIEGITFQDQRSWQWLTNYPKAHYDNGISKNAATAGQYKPTVRMFKNARSRLVERHALTQDVAPSYFLECLLYNAPSGLFSASLQQTYYSIVKWLLENNRNAFFCQNGQLSLFGSSSTQWNTASAESLLAALATLWDNWS